MHDRVKSLECEVLAYKGILSQSRRLKFASRPQFLDSISVRFTTYLMTAEAESLYSDGGYTPAARKRWRCSHLLAEPAYTLGPVLP